MEFVNLFKRIALILLILCGIIIPLSFFILGTLKLFPFMYIALYTVVCIVALLSSKRKSLHFFSKYLLISITAYFLLIIPSRLLPHFISSIYFTYLGPNLVTFLVPLILVYTFGRNSVIGKFAPTKNGKVESTKNGKIQPSIHLHART
jgi:hypothetical protein